jgi:uncharacterized surface protein with fasciclin (FAS1) repeats
MRMPKHVVAACAAVAIVLILTAVPLGSAIQASSPVAATMLHDGCGHARFEPNELPNPFVRDFGDRAEWWQYELYHGHYVRTYQPVKYGDQEISYRKTTRSDFQQLIGGQAAVPAPTEEEATVAAEAESPDSGNRETGGFSTFAAVVKAAGLEDIIFREGPETVFAPTDEAFAALPEGKLDELLADPEGALTQLLLHHVVPGAVRSADLTDGIKLQTREGTPLRVSVVGDSIMVDNANLVGADIETANGVVHVIDAVLLPVTSE